MDRAVIEAKLKAFLSDEFLDGQGEDLEGDTPLLELGIIDSVALVAISGFLEDEFGVELLEEDMTPTNFESLNKLSQMVLDNNPSKAG